VAPFAVIAAQPPLQSACFRTWELLLATWMGGIASMPNPVYRQSLGKMKAVRALFFAHCLQFASRLFRVGTAAGAAQ
jgi:hypothetical protein